MTGQRRVARKAGGPIGFVTNNRTEARPLDSAERTALAAALGVTIERLDAPLKSGMQSLGAAFEWALVEFVRHRLSEAVLPTEREVSTEYAALASHLEDFASSISSPASG